MSYLRLRETDTLWDAVDHKDAMDDMQSGQQGDKQRQKALQLHGFSPSICNKSTSCQRQRSLGL
jgi:hypothetical protein